MPGNDPREKKKLEETGPQCRKKRLVLKGEKMKITNNRDALRG